MPGRHVPADHSRGDANTIGGYMAVHDRPAAFEGPDGISYSVEIVVERDSERARKRESGSAPAWGAYFLFLKWRRIGSSGVEGHLETDFLAWGETEGEARAALGALSLNETRDILYALIKDKSGTSTR